MDTVTPFRFYGHSQSKEGWRLSNFSPHVVIIGGEGWATNEHYFQAMKFEKSDPDWCGAIRTVSTPTTAKKMGNNRSHPIDPNWEKVKDGHMLVALRAKAMQHEDVKSFLLSIGERDIVEAAPNDYYWGEGKNGSGQNKLGKLWKQVQGEVCNL